MAMSYAVTGERGRAALRSEPRAFDSLTLERMRCVSMPRVEPEVQRKEREAVASVLLDMDELMAPQQRRRFTCEDDDASQRHGDVAAPRQHPAREPAIAHVEPAAVHEAWARAREPTEEMTERIRVVRDQVTGCLRRSAPPTR